VPLPTVQDQRPDEFLTRHVFSREARARPVQAWHCFQTPVVVRDYLLRLLILFSVVECPADEAHESELRAHMESSRVATGHSEAGRSTALVPMLVPSVEAQFGSRVEPRAPLRLIQTFACFGRKPWLGYPFQPQQSSSSGTREPCADVSQHAKSFLLPRSRRYKLVLVTTCSQAQPPPFANSTMQAMMLRYSPLHLGSFFFDGRNSGQPTQDRRRYCRIHRIYLGKS
jgi:hypothetical protein